jgi:hypothetical protein
MTNYMRENPLSIEERTLARTLLVDHCLRMKGLVSPKDKLRRRHVLDWIIQQELA